MECQPSISTKNETNTKEDVKERIAAFGYRIGMLHRLYRLCTDSLIAKIGIPFALVPFLTELYDQDGITQETLALRVCMDKGSTARAVAKLERKGLVRRQENMANRRQKIVYLTEKAAQLRDAYFEPLFDISEKMSAGFSKNERRMLLSFFDEMTKNLQEELSRQDKPKNSTRSNVKRRQAGKPYFGHAGEP